MNFEGHQKRHEEFMNQIPSTILDFIKNHPYPAYSKLHDYVFKFDVFKEVALCYWSEYSENNHILIKEIYNNILNKDIIKRNGEIINSNGGFTAMQGVFYVMISSFRMMVKTSEEGLYFEYIKNLIHEGWNGVGEWRG